MSLYAKLQQRAAEGRPIRIGLIGAGKFGSMYLAQVPRTPGVHLLGIADLSPATARANLARVGWDGERLKAESPQAALRTGATWITDDWQALVAFPDIDIIVECTGNPIAAVQHCLQAFDHGKHVVNVTVEADAFCGPLLGRRAAQAGVVYSLAYGDQPALICDLVDWARACGFPVVAAGRGHKWLPHFAQSTPETVWGYYGLTPEQAERGGLNPKMFNSFLDGSKPSIESAAVANATGLGVPSNGLLYPPAGIQDIPFVTRPVSEGGVLERKGMVEVVSSLEKDGRAIPYDIRMGVWVTVEAETDYIKHCFEEYNAHTDPSGRYFTLYKRWHLIGPGKWGMVGGVGRIARRTHGRRHGHGRRMSSLPPKGICARAKSWTARAAIPYGASCCPPRHRPAWAACRWAWRTRSSWSGRSPRARAWCGTTWPWIQAPMPTGCAAKWKPAARRRKPEPPPDRRIAGPPGRRTAV